LGVATKGTLVLRYIAIKYNKYSGGSRNKIIR